MSPARSLYFDEELAFYIISALHEGNSIPNYTDSLGLSCSGFVTEAGGAGAGFAGEIQKTGYRR